MPLASSLRNFLRRHYWFWVLFVLFVGFRLGAILLMRPGGYIADASDYDFYQLWGQTIPMGYTTFQNLWTAYPPLFPALMLPIFELSSRIPAWVEPRLFFHVLFGGFLLLFEAGNLILIYRLGNKLAADSAQSPAESGTPEPPHAMLGDHPLLPGLLPAMLYALMFAPVYTLLGWFEALPLFFLLLGLDLLLVTRRWGWPLSAVAAALGFLIKLTPIVLVPLAVRWLGAKLSVRAAREEWFNRRSPGNLLRPALYVSIFAAVVVGLGLPLARFNLQLALSSFRVNNIRPPWQSIWALLDGFYGYGLVPVDMRNMQGFVSGGQWQSKLPWGLITLAFLTLYLWLYTRRYDWSRIRTPIAFTGISLVWLFLYSKGWSPQFVVWIIAMLVLLNPSLYGVLLAVVLTAVNFVEAQVFLVLLPDEHWILWATVLIRTVLLLLIAAQWLGQIWPTPATARRLATYAMRAGWAVMALALVVAAIGTPRAAQAYWDRRTAEHPCRDAITLLRDQAGGSTRTIVTPQTDVWRDLYPWLRDAYAIRIVDGYDPNDRPAADVIGDKLAAQAQQGEFWWIEQGTNQATGQNWSESLTKFAQRPGVALLDEQRSGPCHLARVVQLPAQQALATADVAGGPILLLGAHTAPGQRGQNLPLVLYWQAQAPVTASYTVFTQLFDPAGKIVAQQDNLPVQGLAPTDKWQPGAVIRDPYTLALPAGAQPGNYSLQVGLYDANGRRQLKLAGGTAADHLTLTVHVD